jgi:hypothetical protein
MNFTVFSNRSLPWILVVILTLLHHRLKGGRQEGMTAEAEFLDHCLIPVE